MNILAIHSHPDDVEIFAAGTILHLIERGHQVTICTMTPGDCGTVEYGPEEIAQIRRGEAAAGAKFAGAAYICAEFRDLAVFSDDPSRRRVTEIIRSLRPEIVITASPQDYHCDHEATSILVRDACFGVSAPNYITGGSARALDAIPHLYFCDPAEGMDRYGQEIRPDFVVNIASQLTRKAEMLGCHVSQRTWLQRQHGMDDYIETMREWSGARGRMAGFEFGEGFRQYMCHPYPRTPGLQSLLGPELVRAL
jgi:LmbE family N-acetylglucosaminyl deacetylase